MAKVRVGIVGGTGYTGVELVRLLVQHPEVDLVALTSRAEAGRKVADLYPNLRDRCELAFSEPDDPSLLACDVVFFATPHNVAMKSVPDMLARGQKVIDLSADFRLRDASQWSHWYNEAHAAPELLEQAVYGLPERNRNAIAKAQLVACAGCYPTAVQLGFMPLLESNLVDSAHLIANAASGVSGAGRQANVANLFAEMSDSFKAYGVSGHRHLPELEQELGQINGSPVGLTFVPHLLPTIRGIHATLYATLVGDCDDIQSLFEDRYREEPFVDVLAPGDYPQTRSVRGSNHCRIAVARPQQRDTVVVMSVIDNLVKGASGQAVQCMNIMCGFPETDGLTGIAMMP